MRLKALSLLVLAALAGVFYVRDAEAACLTCSCTVSADPLSFGSLSPLMGPVDAVGEIEVSCIGLTTALDSISLRLSTGVSGTYASRQLRNGVNVLPYNLYSDPARTVVWGNGTGGSSELEVQNQFSLITWTTSAPVYARVSPAPSAPPGTYTDTIIVTVEW